MKEGCTTLRENYTLENMFVTIVSKTHYKESQILVNRKLCFSVLHNRIL